MAELGAALIGAGMVAGTHLAAIRDAEAVRLTGVWSRTPARAEATGARVYTSLEEVAADPAVDFAIVVTPPNARAEILRPLIAAGKHILLEKPVARDGAEARAVVEICEDAGVTLGISFQRRFHPSMIELRKRVRDGSLGTIDYCTAEMTTSSALSMPAGYWRTDPSEAPAGAMTGIGVHLVDGMIDLFGEIDEVYCLNARRAAPHADDTTAVMLRHRGGVIGTFTGCFATVPGYRFEVAGSGGTGEITGPFLEKLVITPMPEGKHGTPPTVSETIETPGYNMLGAALEAFADAVESGQPFPITPDQIRHGVAVFEAIVRSAGSGQPVKGPG